jgi:hypothetical protein
LPGYALEISGARITEAQPQDKKVSLTAGQSLRLTSGGEAGLKVDQLL